MIYKKIKSSKGLSLVEILIVISVFAVLTIIASNAIFLTLKGAKKSDSQIRVRENLNYAISVVERQIRNSQSVVCPTTSDQLEYVSLEGLNSSFSCQSEGDGFYIASGSARLTSMDVTVLNCQLTCVQSTPNNPPRVIINLTGRDANVSSNVEGATVSIETQISVRNY